MKLRLVLLLSPMFIAACGPAGADELLVGSWQRISEEESDGTRFTPSESCRNDDVMEYTKDGRWSSFQGATLCEGSDISSVSSGGWTLEGGGTILVETDDAFAGEYQAVIDELTEERFVRTHATGLLSGPESIRWTHVRVAAGR